MNAIKNQYAYVLKSIKKDTTLIPKISYLSGKTYIVSGASRGIGFNIAKKLVKKGANVTIVGKTTTPNPKLDGTIFTALEDLQKLANKNKVLGFSCDIRNPKEIDMVIKETLNVNNSIDGVVLNASALCLNDTLKQSQ